MLGGYHLAFLIAALLVITALIVALVVLVPEKNREPARLKRVADVPLAALSEAA